MALRMQARFLPWVVSLGGDTWAIALDVMERGTTSIPEMYALARACRRIATYLWAMWGLRKSMRVNAGCLLLCPPPQVQGLVSEGDGTLQAQLLEMLRLLLDAETMQAVSGHTHTQAGGRQAGREIGRQVGVRAGRQWDVVLPHSLCFHSSSLRCCWP